MVESKIDWSEPHDPETYDPAYKDPELVLLICRSKETGKFYWAVDFDKNLRMEAEALKNTNLPEILDEMNRLIPAFLTLNKDFIEHEQG